MPGAGGTPCSWHEPQCTQSAEKAAAATVHELAKEPPVDCGNTCDLCCALQWLCCSGRCICAATNSLHHEPASR
jgi:hypothetical protein